MTLTQGFQVRSSSGRTVQGTVAPPKHLRETLNLTETPALLLNLRLETGLQSKERNVASGRGEA